MARARFSRFLLPALIACALAAPSGALAAGKPLPRTGAAVRITQTTATLGGSVDPNGRRTRWFFQYGPTVLYGASTAPGVVPRGRRVGISANVAGLAPFTTYHYRLVAQNGSGLSVGADRTFRTRRQPLAVSLAATPNPVPFGRGTTMAGTLTGTGGGGRIVTLQGNPWPYTQGFQAFTNSQITSPQGTFSFILPIVTISTQFRVVVPRTRVVSTVVPVAIAARVVTHVRRRHTRRGLVARFFGSIHPARDGASFAVQKRRRGQWVTVAGGVTRHATSTFSAFAKSVRVRRTGTYRVYIGLRDGAYVSNVGRSVRIRAR